MGTVPTMDMTRRWSQIWPVVHAERDALIEDLAGLPTAKWDTPSLCPGWDVHDVVAHLVDTAQTTRLSFTRRMVAARFDFDRDNAEGILRERADDPLRTLDRFRAARSRTSTPPAAAVTRLVEAFVHGEDIRRPLKINTNYPPAHVATALGYQVKTRISMGGGKENARGWRLVASDTPFAQGHGPVVNGSAISLLMAVSGRPVAADELSGAGASAFSAALREGSG